jgi:uncharacterized protein YrzB (UPF0473 family)
VLQYTFVTIDDDGKEVLVAQGEFQPGVDAHEVGETVSLPDADGVEKSWKIVRTVPIPYGGMSFYVERAD